MVVQSPSYPHQRGAISVLSTPKCGADKAYHKFILSLFKILKQEQITPVLMLLGEQHFALSGPTCDPLGPHGVTLCTS